MFPGPDSNAPLQPPVPRRRVGSRLLSVFLTALFLAILAHRPILHYGLTVALKQVAKANGFKLSTKLSGNIFTELNFINLELKPITPDQSALANLQVDSAKVHFKLRRLLQSGPAECVDSCSLDGITVQLISKPKTDQPSPKIGELLESILTQPGFYTDALTVRNLNLTIENGDPLAEIRNANVSFLPNQIGKLEFPHVRLVNHNEIESWHGETSYHNRTPEIRGLKLGPGIEIESLAVDMSRRSEGKGVASISVRLNDGRVTAAVSSQKQHLKEQSHLSLDFSASHLLLADFNKTLGVEPATNPAETAPFSMAQLAFITEVEWAEGHVKGNPLKPDSWDGRVDLRANTPYAETQLVTSELHATFHEGTLLLDSLHLKSQDATAQASGEIKFGPLEDLLTNAAGRVQAQITIADFSHWAPLPGLQNMKGKCHIATDASLAKGFVEATFKAELDTPSIDFVRCSRGTVESKLKASLANLTDTKKLSGNVAVLLEAPSLTAQTVQASLEKLAASASFSNGNLTIESLLLQKGENRLTASGQMQALSPNAPAQFEIHADCASIEETGLVIRERPVAGKLNGDFVGKLEKGEPEGTARLSAGPIFWGGFEVEQLELNSLLKNHQLQIHELALLWNKDEWIRASGFTDLREPRAYQTNAEARLSKLERFDPLLQQSGLEGGIRGSLRANWSGEGTLHPVSGNGRWDISLENGHWKSVTLNEFACSGTYGPGELKAAPVRIVTPQARLNTQIHWSEDSLRIQELALEQWGYPTLSGFIVLPIGWNAKGPHWNENGRISGQLNANGLDLVTLFTSAGIPAPVSGAVKFTLLLSGTPTEPAAGFNLTAQELRYLAFPGLGTAQATLNGKYAGGILESTGTVRSALESPLEIQARIPVSLGDLILGKTPPKQIPTQAHLQISNANLKMLPALWPGLKKFEGTASLNVNVEGTLESPKWKGTFSLDAPVTHFVSYRFPAITELHAHADFDEKELRLRNVSGDVGGGRFMMDGIARRNENHQTILDFHALAHEVLIVRSRELLLRMDGDVHVQGPWQQATIRGTAIAKKSKVTRDMELLPVNLLKKQALQLPQSGPGKPWFTFQRSPFSEWKFDIALHTTQEDPFLIRGNRLHGSAQADLALKGTGGAPTLEGNYKTTDLVAYMPFARIQISRGHFWYFPSMPFRPQLDFSGETEVRNHRIRLYLTGTPEVPKIALNSDPPLSEPDLLTLVTTGVLPGDTSENGQALAGRAAALLFQELSGKVFDSNGNHESFAALRRFNLDVGALNTRTGHQETKLTYRISDDFFMIGELGANGDFGGQIKYLIRFR